MQHSETFRSLEKLFSNKFNIKVFNFKKLALKFCYLINMQ